MKKRLIRPIYTCSFCLFLAACEAPKEAEDPAAQAYKAEQEEPLYAELNTASLERILLFTQKNWPDFAAKLRPAIIGRFGFKDKDDLLQSALGTPWPMVALGTEDESSLIEQHIWRVPLIKNGKMRLLITVEEQNGELKIVSLGAMELAQKLQENLPLAEKAFKKKYFYILRSYDLNEDYIGAMGSALLSPSERVMELKTARATANKSALPETIAISALREKARTITKEPRP